MRGELDKLRRGVRPHAGDGDDAFDRKWQNTTETGGATPADDKIRCEFPTTSNFVRLRNQVQGWKLVQFRVNLKRKDTLRQGRWTVLDLRKVKSQIQLTATLRLAPCCSEAEKSHQIEWEGPQKGPTAVLWHDDPPSSLRLWPAVARGILRSSYGPRPASIAVD